MFPPARLLGTLLCTLAVAGIWPGIAAAQSTTYAYVANSGSGTVTPVNLSTMKALSPIHVGSSSYKPSAIAVDPSGTYAYVANSGNDSVSVIAMATNTDMATISLPIGSIPVSLAVTPNGKHVYVANEGNSTVSVINVDSISPGADTVGANVKLPSGAAPTAVRITPNGELAYVVDNGIAGITPIKITSGNSTGPTFYGVGSNPWDLAISGDGSTGYVSSSTAGDVVAFSIPADGVTKVFSAGQVPTAIALSGTSSFMYVANKESKNISSINLSSGSSGTIGLPGSYAATDVATWTNGSGTPYLFATIPNGSSAGILDPINLNTGASGAAITVGKHPAAIAIGTAWQTTNTTSYDLGTLGTKSKTTPTSTIVVGGSHHRRHHRRHLRGRTVKLGNHKVRLKPIVHGKIRKRHGHLCVAPKAKLIFKLTIHRRHHGRKTKVKREELFLGHHRKASKRHGKIKVKLNHLHRGRHAVIAKLKFNVRHTRHVRRNGHIVRVHHMVHRHKRIKLKFHVC